MKVRLAEHPRSKLLHEISAKDAHLICYTISAIFKTSFKNCLLIRIGHKHERGLQLV